MKLHHFGIVVRDLSKSIPIYKKLGYQFNNQIVWDKEQHIKVVFLSNQGINLELIEPTDQNSTVSNSRTGYHHICYEADPGEDIISSFKEKKLGKIFTKPIVAPALSNRKIVFACLQNGTFVELII